MGKSAPQAPDPARTASQQGQWNSYSAQLQQMMNMVNQNSPWGSLNYNQTGTQWITDPSGRRVEVPTYTAETRLSPEQQRIFDASQAAQGNLAETAQERTQWLQDYLKEPFSFNNQDAENWSWDLASQRILPQQQQAQQNLENQLLNRGIRPGSAAYDKEMQRLTNANTDQMNQLALQGRSQAFNEQLTQRNQPLNEIMALLGGANVQNPNSTFAQTPQSQVGGVDYSGLVNNQYNQLMNQYNARMGAIGGLGGMALGGLFSDVRMKEDIEPIGTTYSGTPIYRYRYKGGSPYQYGVLAQEIMDSQPDAVTLESNGMYSVDYRKVK